MKIKLAESNQLKSRRHSGRLFNYDLNTNNNNASKLDYNDIFMEHDSSSSMTSLSSLNNYANQSNSATTSFVATSSNTAENISNILETPATMSNKKTIHTNNIYRNNKAPELFRTDFITAMKLGTDYLTDETCIRISDSWKQEWEKGVQVPNSKYLTKPNYVQNKNFSESDDYEEFFKNENEFLPSELPHKMPDKLICPIDDKNYNPKIHEAHLAKRIQNIQNRKLTDCLIATSKYEYDETDDIWLTKVNDEFSKAGLARLNHMKFEKIIENFENQSFEMLKNYLDKLCLYKIEYDPAVVCDVCRSPDSEPTNEIVFCDGCNVCVHQNCYGIEQIPEGNWLCSACEYGGPKPECCLCPSKGGALKPTKDHKQWCHVSCILWTPEVTFGNTDKYEPVINLSKIPTEKWLHKCSLCKYRKGCCVECASNRCFNTFHITCAFKHNLKTMETTNQDGLIEFSCLCKKHSKLRRDDAKIEPIDYSILNTTNGNNEHDITLSEDISISEEKFHLAIQSMNETDRKTEIIKRLEILYHKFYYKVSVEKTITDLELTSYTEQVNLVYNYWKLKRRFNKQSNKPLISFRADKQLEFTQANLSPEMSLKTSLFLDIRHRLEYLRNLCFVIKKREKKKEKYFELNRKYFVKLTEYLEKYKTPQNTQNNKTNIKQQQINETWSSCRIRDMLQTKNENIIYDMPENWELFDQNLRNILNTRVPLDTQNTVNFDQINNQKITKSTGINKTVLRTRSKSTSNNSLTNESIKDIINVLNNNTNVDTTNINKTKQNNKSNSNSNSNSSNNINSKYVLSNCENTESVNRSERRLLRSYSVYSDGSKNNLNISIDTSTDCINDLNTKTRLSLPSVKRTSSIININNNISNQNNNKSRSDSCNDFLQVKNSKSKESKKTATTSTLPTTITSTRTKKRFNSDCNSATTIVAKRARYNDDHLLQSSPSISSPTPLPPPQTRFNLRTKIEK